MIRLMRFEFLGDKKRSRDDPGSQVNVIRPVTDFNHRIFSQASFTGHLDAGCGTQVTNFVTFRTDETITAGNQDNPGG